MPVFRYTGKTRSGVAQQGEIEANDRSSATAVLRQRQILVTSIKAKPKALQFKIPGFGGKVSEHETVIFPPKPCSSKSQVLGGRSASTRR